MFRVVAGNVCYWATAKITSTADIGATTTSNVAPGKVCFQAVAKLTSTADMGAKLPSTSR
ncbi:hypothetical protein [Mesorhizobium sp. WSM2561]|uniref:hypothetical protein n=1 Tax=Mesorhizobium sp. WSM2561 TaxID=1040985 RepID=UPI00047FF276|nr:hypothetical protein [Mesorhizobium sp. WSM2561]